MFKLKRRSRKYKRIIFDPQRLSKYRTVTQKTGQVIRPKSGDVRGTKLPTKKSEIEDFLEMLNANQQYRISPLPGMSASSITIEVRLPSHPQYVYNSNMDQQPIGDPFPDARIYPMDSIPLDLFQDLPDVLRHFQPYTNIPVRVERMQYEFSIVPTNELPTGSEFIFRIYTYIPSKNHHYPTVPFIDPEEQDDSTRNWLSLKFVESTTNADTMIEFPMLIEPYELIPRSEPAPTIDINLNGPPGDFVVDGNRIINTSTSLEIKESEHNPLPIQAFYGNYILDTPTTQFASLLQNAQEVHLPQTSVYENPWKTKLAFVFSCSVAGLPQGTRVLEVNDDLILTLTFDLCNITSSLS